MKKIVHALAAIVVAVVASLMWVQPAQAAPGGSCAVEEWTNPANFAQCAARLGQSVQDKTGCVTAPSPNSPTAGMAGWFTSQPDTARRDGVQGLYSRYGVGGYGLDTYDLGCLGTIKDPGLTGMTTLANLEFQGAASIMGASNGLREHAYNPGSIWHLSDLFLSTVTHTTYKYVFNPVGCLVLALTGMFLVYRSRNGLMSETMKVSCWALLVTVAITGLAKWPVEAAHGTDAVAAKGLGVVHSIFGPAKVEIPADQCVLGGDACTDFRSPATRASDVAVETVLYKSWLRAVLGDADSKTAETYGPALYDATAISWGEAERIDGNPTLRQQLLEQKAQQWNAIAAKIRTEDPVAYEYLQGKHSSDRVGAGAIAIGSAGAFSLFDSIASLLIIVAFGVIRFAIIVAPLIGTVGIFYYTSSGIRRVVHMTTAAVFNVFMFGGYAGIYLMLTGKVFDADGLPGFAKPLIILIIGGLGLVMLYPLRQQFRTMTGRARTEPSATSRARDAARQIRKDNEAEKARFDEAVLEAGRKGEPFVRPENDRSWRRAATVGKAAAPSLAGLPDHPIVSAVRTAGGEQLKRPEKAGRLTQGRSLVSATVAAAAKTMPAPAAPASTDPAKAERPETRS